jgi:hypothetical protein
MAIDTHADHTVAQAVRKTLEIACTEDDPNALVPELIGQLVKRQIPAKSPPLVTRGMS